MVASSCRVAAPYGDRSHWRARRADERDRIGQHPRQPGDSSRGPALPHGRGDYVDSIHFPSEAWCAYVRSPYAHATIESIDVEDAASAPGVLGVFTAADLAGLGPDATHPAQSAPGDEPAVPGGRRVRFVGEPVVAVVAETRPPAVDAAELVIVDYDPLPVVSTSTSRRPARCCSSRTPARTSSSAASPRQADFSGCEVVVSERIVNQRLTGAPIEPRAGAAYWTEDGRLVHYSACQGAHATKATCRALYGLEPSTCGSSCPTWAAGSAPSPAPTRRSGARLVRPRARPAGAVGRDPHREHDGDAAGPGPGPARHDRRDAATAASPPTSSTCSRTPAPTR